jgi:hypothetical protein
VNRVIDPLTAAIENQYRAEFAVGEHSARHLRRILRIYLTGAGLLEVADGCSLLPVPAAGDPLAKTPDLSAAAQPAPRP